MSTAHTVAMVHHHLRRGGVTRVIQNAVAALSETGIRCLVISGEAPPPETDLDAPVAVVSGLGYDDGTDRTAPDTLLARLQDAARAHFGALPDIWHIHNHALGKNAAWTAAVARLAEMEQALVLQIHDFAEDGRAANYRYLHDQLRVLRPDSEPGMRCYPNAPRVHYALLNRRDQQILCRAGLAGAQAHLLPNAVHMSAPVSGPASTPPLILYPTRAIRRKNIGEFLLWSAMEEGEARYGITLAPESVGEQSIYKQWQAFAAAQRLPVAFEMGLEQKFGALLQQATTLFTTSITEGFGLAFLEPWLAGRNLAGRKLPEITHEFEEAEIDLDGLYATLTAPLDWIDADELRRQLTDGVTAAMRNYGRVADRQLIDAAWNTAVQRDRVEFGHLNESLQQQIIVRLQSSATARSEVSPHDWTPASLDRIEANQLRVQRHYGLPQYRQRLIDLYAQVLNGTPAASALNAATVLDQFLDPARFRLLKSVHRQPLPPQV